MRLCDLGGHPPQGDWCQSRERDLASCSSGSSSGRERRLPAPLGPNSAADVGVSCGGGMRREFLRPSASDGVESPLSVDGCRNSPNSWLSRESGLSFAATDSVFGSRSCSPRSTSHSIPGGVGRSLASRRGLSLHRVRTRGLRDDGAGAVVRMPELDRFAEYRWQPICQVVTDETDPYVPAQNYEQYEDDSPGARIQRAAALRQSRSRIDEASRGCAAPVVAEVYCYGGHAESLPSTNSPPEPHYLRGHADIMSESPDSRIQGMHSARRGQPEQVSGDSPGAKIQRFAAGRRTSMAGYYRGGGPGPYIIGQNRGNAWAHGRA